MLQVAAPVAGVTQHAPRGAGGCGQGVPQVVCAPRNWPPAWAHALSVRISQVVSPVSLRMQHAPLGCVGWGQPISQLVFGPRQRPRAVRQSARVLISQVIAPAVLRMQHAPVGAGVGAQIVAEHCVFAPRQVPWACVHCCSVSVWHEEPLGVVMQHAPRTTGAGHGAAHVVLGPRQRPRPSLQPASVRISHVVTPAVLVRQQPPVGAGLQLAFAQLVFAPRHVPCCCVQVDSVA
jgi:hypothetical protein